MVKKMMRKLALKIMEARGYSPWTANLLFYEFIEDFLKTRLSLRKKLWSYRRGFLSGQIFEYGLTEANYIEYETDVHYYKAHPINGMYSRWIDDKITTRYVLHPFAEYMPKYYFQFGKGNVTKLMDCPARYHANIDSVMELLGHVKHLALKRLAGSYGSGFYKLSCDGSDYFYNDKRITQQECMKLLESLDNYFASEYLISHKSIRRIYPSAPNTLRLIVVRDNNDSNVIAAFFRFGTSTTGTIDNFSAGGILCGVDISDGMLFSPKVKRGDRLIDIPVHMDTQVRIEGNVPHWDSIIAKIVEIGDYIPQVKYMGYDIVVTDDGFKIIEINSLPMLCFQVYYPIMKNKSFTNLLYKSQGTS